MSLLLASSWGRGWPFLLKLLDSSNPWTVLIINFGCNEFLEIEDSSHIKQIVLLILIDFLLSKKFFMENFSHTKSRDTLVPPLRSASKKIFFYHFAVLFHLVLALNSCWFFFFWMWTIFKIFIEFVTILLLFYVLGVFFFWPQRR